uniref:ABC2_membrane_7 domain-containing protein n=1 Tax=Haemonchus placei TaxID=6290 RepID=A0A0N4W1F1_HAEPC
LVEWGDMKKLSAYVQQEDLFISQATVEEQLMFTGYPFGNVWLKIFISLPRDMNILSNPRILFCDEPTSGLDSFMSLQIVVALKMFASQGKTVVTTIHQPSSQVYEMADRLILMANGEVAFQGNASEVGEFLNDCGYPCPRFMSLPDHMMKVLSQDDDVSEREFIERVEVGYRLYQPYEQVGLDRGRLGWLLTSTPRSVAVTNIRFPFPGISVVLFILIQLFIAELPVVIREYQSHTYAPSAYFIGTIHNGNGLHLQRRMIPRYVRLDSRLWSSPKQAGAQEILSISAGFLIDLRTVPFYFKPLTYISWYKYAYEAHLIILLNPIDTIPGATVSASCTLPCVGSFQVLNLLGFDSNYFWINFAILLFILFFLRGLALVVFSLRIRHS